VDGDHQRHAAGPCGGPAERQDGQILTEMDVDEIGFARDARHHHRSLGGVELAKPRQRQTEADHLRALSDQCPAWRRRWARGDDDLLELPAIQRASQLGRVVLHPTDRVEALGTGRDHGVGRLED
jgi:hypothetical protein